MLIRPKNWREFQHYKNRRPPWIRLYRTLLDNFEFISLPLASKALAPLLWLLASESVTGEIEADVPRLAFRLRMTEAEVSAGLTPLIESGLFEVASKTLAKRSRRATPETETETETDTTAAARPPRERVPHGTEIVTDDWFLNFKLAYPDRSGSQPWQRARKAANARMAEGHTPEDFLAGAKRYAAFIAATGKANTEFVMQAATFLGPDKPFAQAWDQPETPATRTATQRAQLEQRQFAELRTRAEKIGFRQPTDADDLLGYRTLVERAEAQRPRAGAIQPIAKLLGSQPS